MRCGCSLPSPTVNFNLMNAIFETERLVVRNLKPSDFEAFHEMQADDEVMRYTTGSGLEQAENERQLSMCIDCYSKHNNHFWVWAVVRKSDHEFIGTCAVVPSDDRPEIGYRMRRKWFGIGYGQEICDALMHYCIQELGLSEVIAYADVRNVASVKILDRSVLAFVEQLVNDAGHEDRFYRWVRGDHPTVATKLG